jgi:hypothetical protein
MQSRHYYSSAFVFLLICLAAFRVRASTVVYEDGGSIFSDTENLIEFDDIHLPVLMPGTYKASLVDFKIPTAFDLLSLGIAQDGKALGFTFANDTFKFDVVESGTVTAKLVANPTGSSGFYAMQIMAVPIPPAIWLFLSALTGIVSVARRGAWT